MTHSPMDNGDYFMRAQRAAQQEILQQYQAQQQNPYLGYMLQQYQPYQSMNPYAPHYRPQQGPTPGEVPEPEDTTGLKLLDEFLQRRKRDGIERKQPEGGATGGHVARTATRAAAGGGRRRRRWRRR